MYPFSIERKDLNNKNRITLISFLGYFVMSGMLAPIGIISAPMSEYFGQPITELIAHFSWLTFGILAGAVIALLVFDLIRLKRLMVILYCLIIACLVSFALHDNLDWIWPALGLVGVCCGVGLAGAALIISRTYDADRRASMLVITDGSLALPALFAPGSQLSSSRGNTIGRALTNLSRCSQSP